MRGMKILPTLLIAVACAPALAEDAASGYQRFHGVYGSPDRPGRDFFVAAPSAPPGSDLPPPPGDLAIGAMWGDVAPWRLNATGELRFEEIAPSPYQPAPLRVEFIVDSAGAVTGMRFETLFEDRGELVRTGDLPEGW